MMTLPIRIILVHTTHPGNIGSVARAMKTMGLHELYLVAPKVLPEETAVALASGAVDLLEKAVVVDTLDEAIADCTLVCGLSARARYLAWPSLTPREMAEKVLSHATSSPVAILFGRERDGLTNEQLARCHYHITIPTAPEYASLNLAGAVQIACYEIYQQFKLQASLISNEKGMSSEKEACEKSAANMQEVESFFIHLEKTLEEIEFLDTNNPRLLMQRLRRLFMRSQLEKAELNALRGILTAVQQRTRS